MDTLKINSKNTLMVAHRGVSGLETENTNAAFIAAGNRSYFGVETDVHKTKDGKWVVIHDSDPERVSGVSLNIEESTLEEIRAVRLRDVISGETRGDLVIPTLEEYVNTCKKYGKKCVLEIKTPFTYEDVAAMTKVIEGLGYLDNVIMISFFMESLIYYRQQYPNNPAQYLCGELSDEDWKKLIDNHLDIDILHTFVTDELLKKAHGLGLKVNCWTVNLEDLGQKYVDMGVDFITTNILE